MLERLCATNEYLFAELQWFVNRKRLDEPSSDKMPALKWNTSSIQKTVTNTFGKINFVNIEHAIGTKPAKV